MRVASGNVYAALNRALMQAGVRVAEASRQAGSGERIVHASDNPVDASQLLRLDSEISRGESYTRTATDTAAWLATTDRALIDMMGILQRANDLGLAGMNGALSQGERDAIAEELLQIRDQMATAANTSYLGQAVFAGFSSAAVTKTVDPATQVASFAFTGQVGDVERKIDPNTTVSASTDGRAVLGFDAAPGKDVFSVLDDMAAQIRAGNLSGAASARADLEDRFESVANASEVIGARTLTLERVQSRLDGTIQDARSARSAIGEVDLAKAMLEMQSAQTAYQAALSAVAKASMPTLSDYL